MNTTFEKSAGKDEWLTPLELVVGIGQFDLDPCAPVKRPWPTAFNHFTIEDDGLSKPWAGKVWLNPPYGNQTQIWMEKLASEHRNGVALTYARTETAMFFESIWPKATALKFIQKRLSFYEFACSVCGNGQSIHDADFEKKHHKYISAAPIVVKGGFAGSPSVLISYGDECTAMLYRSKVTGKFVPLILKLSLEIRSTWRQLVRFLMQECDGVISLDDLYEAVALHPKSVTNTNWKAKVRQQVQREGRRIGPALWQLNLV